MQASRVSVSFVGHFARIVRQKVSTKSLMAALSDCFPSSYCLLLHEYQNLVPNSYNIQVKVSDKDMAAIQDLVLAFCPEETETLDACTQCVSKFVLAQKARALNTVKL